MKVAGVDIELARPVQYRYVDRSFGELVRPLTIVPAVAVDLRERSLVFGDGKPRKVEVPVRSNTGKVAGDVSLVIPNGWKAEPPSRRFDLGFAGEQTTLTFDLTPPAEARGTTQGKLVAVAKVGERNISAGTSTIVYSHIPVQTIFPPAEASLVRTDIQNLARNVGYVMGAGDEVPGSLRQIGCNVTMLGSEDLARGDLSKYDAIVTGVRAFNTRPDLRANYQRLFDYANNGGTVIVQYNVPEGGGPAGVGNPALLEHIGPYPIRISRSDRVTVEEAPISFPNPSLPVLHKPNQITGADFDGWIQERGLYFSDQWDPKYQSVLESHDPGEQPMPGGMLYAKVGKGAYFFSAYDWFRELPAGVPGAYRLFANMLSASKVQ